MSHLIELADELNVCRSKISLITDLFSHQSPVEFSDYSQAGLGYIFDDIIESLNQISKKIEGMIKENSSGGEVSE